MYNYIGYKQIRILSFQYIKRGLGIFMHGLGNLLMGLCGTGVGIAAFSQKIGGISITKVMVQLSFIIL